MEPGRRGGDSIAGRLLRRLGVADGGIERCSVCDLPLVVDGHCIRRGDTYMHAQCALYRRRPVRAA
jgi:hypothetical protein